MEVIYWGGQDENFPLNTGGKYNPSTDSWIATSIANAPSARSSHTAVWTDNQMIIWAEMIDLDIVETRVVDIIPIRTVGRLLALSMRLLRETVIRQSGLAVR